MRCIVIAGSDKVFAAGADIRAMAERPLDATPDPAGMDFWKGLAATATPTIAAVSGYALGGGCELALACDMIVADDKARFGQPETTLGIIPGGGGTQRLARAIGKQRAMEYVLTGRLFDAKTAQSWGLVNVVVGKGRWLTEALELARTIAARAPLAARLAKEAVLVAEETPLSEGLERRAGAVRAGDGNRGPGRGHAGLRRKARAGLQGPVTVTRVGILGAGTMGAGIAQVAALGGYETLLYDALPGAAEKGAARLGEALAKGAARGRWNEAEAAAASERTRPAATLADLAGCELLVEAAPEDLELKRELFGAAAEACGADTVLASNTSSLRVTEIAAGVPHPERVVGMHFFNPPALMKLVEVVATEWSSERALAATTEVAKAMGRTPIQAKDSPGFVANRLARPFSLESLRILGDGVADAATIDRVVRLGGGFRMGPFELLDLIGLDVNLTIARSFFAQGGEPERWRPSPIQERLVEEGKLGRKSGEGYYSYAEDGGIGVPSSRIARKKNSDLERPAGEAPTLDPGALAQIDPAGTEILPRLFAQIANEAAFARAEEIASAADMETAMRLGFNWPLGPLAITDLIGPARAVAVLTALETEHGEAYSPAPLLRAKAEETDR